LLRMSRSITINDHHGIRWQVSAPYAGLFLASRPPDPRRLLRASSGSVIKKSITRIIFSSEIGLGVAALPVVVKIYRHARFGDWLKANLLGSKARQEWRITSAAVARGLRTVTPVAFGERRRLGILRESYLVTVRIFDCVTLEEAVFSADGTFRVNAAERRELITMLATLLRQMHDRGIYHRDLHPGNFLVERTGGHTQRLYLLDLHRASAARTLSLTKRIKSLAQFNMFASLSLSRSERLLFFTSYFGEDEPWRQEKRNLLDRIDEVTLAMRWRLWKRRERRCVEPNRYFMRLRFARLSRSISSITSPSEGCGRSPTSCAPPRQSAHGVVRTPSPYGTSPP
ncbi:MAG: phosphotransferase, partial [Candidatus Aureabacteria bacterium]|nr:phosphotransferase [Candidatus Auribacterota bacterium]